jgi:hypothetical protein
MNPKLNVPRIGAFDRQPLILSLPLLVAVLLGAMPPGQCLEIINATGGIAGRNVAITALPVGTYTIGAYSDLVAVAPPFSPNALVKAQWEVPPGAVPPARYVPGVVTFNTGTWPFRVPYTGIGDVWTKPLVAPAPGNVGADSVQSECPAVAANLDSTLGWGHIMVTAASYTLRVRGDLIISGVGVGGQGVGYSLDPYPVEPGTYPYAPILSEITLTNQSGQVDATATLLFSAQSSLDTNTPVWALSMILRGDDVLDVKFQSMSSFFDVPLDDATVTSNLLSALVITNHTVRLRPEFVESGYTLFESSFTATQTFDFGEDATGIAQAPARPSLEIQRRDGTQATLSWSTNAVGYLLETCPALGGLWIPVPNPPERSGERFTVTTDTLSEHEYFRLRLQ